MTDGANAFRKRKYGRTLLWTILVFVTLTLLTMENDAASDGFNRYGFPFTFYDYFGGLCDHCYDKYGFRLTYLLADFFLTGLVTHVVFVLLGRYKFQRELTEKK